MAPTAKNGVVTGLELKVPSNAAKTLPRIKRAVDAAHALDQRDQGDEAVDRKAEGVALALDMPFFVRRAAPTVLPQSDSTLCQIAGANGIALH